MVTIAFCIWALAVTYRQAYACYWLVEKKFYTPTEGEGEIGKWAKRFEIGKQALLISQSARYAGTRKKRYHVAEGDTVANSNGDNSVGFSSSPDDYKPAETTTSLYSRLTALPFCSRHLKMFDVLDPPKRSYKPEEVVDTPSIMTKNNWTMQKMWCSGNIRQNSMIIARGPSALSPDQIKLSVLCTILSAVLSVLTLVGILVWMNTGAGSYIIVAILSMIYCIVPLAKNSREMHQMYLTVREDANTSEEDTGASLIQVWETVRITQPKPWYCYARVVTEFFFLFLWPFAVMLVKRNYPVALIFLCLGSFTFIWRYFDAATVLAEYGPIAKINELTHLQKYRTSEIVEGIVNNNGE